MIIFFKYIFLTILILISNFSLAETLSGYFKTETSETGGYLIVEMGLCENNKKLTCGKIVEAEWDDNGSKITDYEHLNKLIVWDMISKGDGQYANGKIWDPSSNNDDGSKKIYNSKMSLSGNTLSVSGCILIFCKAQNWTKVN